jgi:hypothetical protein
MRTFFWIAISAVGEAKTVAAVQNFAGIQKIKLGGGWRQN